MLPIDALAQGAAAASRAAAPPRVVPTRLETPPVIDGRIDDAEWKTAAHIDAFVQQRPIEGTAASERTDVYVGYDADRLYLAVYAHYTDVSQIRANRVDRDQTANDDTVSFFFDPFLDRQRGYVFSVNAYGVQGDALLQNMSTSGQSSSGDSTWNALFQSAGAIVDDGWTAEIAIPVKSLRYPSKAANEVHRWGFQIQREIRGKDETITWAPVSMNTIGFLTQMGVLDGMRNLSVRRNFEIMPTLTALGVTRLDATVPRYDDSDVQEGGINLKYGLTPNVTLDFTFNPDFSQIESDQPQIEVNQRFPLLFAELRPFFLEGQEIFQVPGPVGTLVHTRTILDPQYGLKVSGKTGKTTFGALAANDEAPGRVDASNPLSGQNAQILVGRAKYDLYRESYFGGMVTNRTFADSYSRLGFLDGVFRLGRSARVAGQVVYSRRRDLAGVERTGHVINADIRRESHNLSLFGAHNEISPGFGSDLAFVRRVDQKQTFGSVSYRWWPGGAIVNWGPGAQYDVYYDFEGHHTDDKKRASVNFNFAKNITATAAINRDLERYRNIDFNKTRYSLSTTIYTNQKILLKADTSGGDEIRFITNPYLGVNRIYNLTATLRPSTRFQSLVTLNTTRFTDVRTQTTDFDVKIIRALTTYQFTQRLLIRNILETNTLNKTFGVNLLGTYRVNAGTVFFIGYDDRYRQGDQLNPSAFPTDEYQRTNRAMFAKLQYLYRY